VMIVGESFSDEEEPCVIVTKDPLTGTISSTCVEPSPFDCCLYQCTATRVGEEVFVFGGCIRSSYENTLHIYSIAKGTWREVEMGGEGPEGRCQHSAFCLGGKLYIAGGFGDNQRCTDMWCYDPETESWTQREDPPEVVRTAATTVVGNTAHLMGCDDNDALHLTYTEAKGWKTRTLPFELMRGAAVTVGTDIHVIGGMYSREQVHVYNTKSKKWSAYPGLPVDTDAETPARLDAGACMLSETCMLVHGDMGTLVGTRPETKGERKQREKREREWAVIREERERHLREREAVLEGERQEMASVLSGIGVCADTMTLEELRSTVLPHLISRILALERGRK
ncbi:hypothetical protein KIPB_008549, partial [Kipferlia bialata]